jgi:hypothetical protein
MWRRFGMIGVAALLGSVAYAQDIAGNWQGTLKAGPQDLRLLCKLSKATVAGRPQCTASIRLPIRFRLTR